MEKLNVILHLSDNLEVFVEVEEKVDKKTGRTMVVAKAIDCENLMLESLTDVFHAITDMTIEDNSRLWANLLLKPVYVSVARCHPEDTYDFKKGVRVALMKLKEKLENKIMGRRYVLAKELYAMAIRCYPPEPENMVDMVEDLKKKIEKFENEEE